MSDQRFEWDERKNSANQKKHSISVVVVCHCYRENEDVIRIISARKATAAERNEYMGRLP